MLVFDRLLKLKEKLVLVNLITSISIPNAEDEKLDVFCHF